MSERFGVGNAADSKAFGTAQIGKQTAELILGEHPHSRSDNNVYARYPGGRIEEFDGHLILTRVEIEEYNYLKQSGLSGDEVRKGGTCRIFFNGKQVYEFFFREVERAFHRAASVVDALKESPSSMWESEKLLGRKIYYRDHPAIITSVIAEQGCIIVEPDGCVFSTPPWALQDGYPAGNSQSVKTEVISPDIWWFRD